MAVVKAMKTYGLVLADNGSPWYFQGEQNAAVAGPADRGPQADPGARRSSRSTPRRSKVSSDSGATH